MRGTDPFAGVAAFVRLAETRSFRLAAERLGVSRATLSAQVRELEARLGVRLVQRTTRHVSLTEAGQVFLASLGDALPRVEEARAAVQALHRNPSGLLRVTAPVEFGHLYIVPTIGAFLDEHPSLSVELHLTNEFVNLVEQGFDLAIRATRSLEPQTIARRIGCSEAVLCASDAYLARAGVPRRPEDLADHDLIVSGRHRAQGWPLHRDGRDFRMPVEARLTTDGSETDRVAARAGLGIAILPAFAAAEDFRTGRLRPVLQDWMRLDIEIFAVYPANRQIATKVRRFVDFLAARLAEREELNVRRDPTAGETGPGEPPDPA